MGDFLIIPCLNCIKISQKQAWRPLIYFAWMKSMHFREYVCRFSRKSHYFCILGVSHLNQCIYPALLSSLMLKRNKYFDSTFILPNHSVGWSSETSRQEVRVSNEHVAVNQSTRWYTDTLLFRKKRWIHNLASLGKICHHDNAFHGCTNL